ncbi:MAG: four helix bundle protein [bacterium]
MNETPNNKNKKYDLEERTLAFAKKIIQFANNLPKTISNIEIAKQLVKAGTSVGANYIEANEALSKKDFIMRIKICRKESKESIYWLKLAEIREQQVDDRKWLIGEATELLKIFSSIIEKSK